MRQLTGWKGSRKSDRSTLFAQARIFLTDWRLEAFPGHRPGMFKDGLNIALLAR
jgi:hypothetical protein